MLAMAIRAAMLDGRIYGQIGDEPQAMFRSLGIVVAVAVAFGLGQMNSDFAGLQGSPTLVLLVVATTVVLGWLLWGTIAYIVGSRVLGGDASHRMLLRSLGLAYAPGIVMVFASTPAVGGAVGFVGPVWILASGMVAVRETLAKGWPRAVLPGVAGWFLAVVILPVVFLGPAIDSGA